MLIIFFLVFSLIPIIPISIISKKHLIDKNALSRNIFNSYVLFLNNEIVPVNVNNINNIIRGMIILLIFFVF